MIKTFRKKGHPMHSGGAQEWEETDKADTLNIFDNSESRTPIVIVMCSMQEEMAMAQYAQPLLESINISFQTIRQ